MGWITLCAELLGRLPWEKIVVKERSQTESLQRLQATLYPAVDTPHAPQPKLKQTGYVGVPDHILLMNARRRLKYEGVKLRSHLTAGCRIENIPCDCCEKGMINMEHALEDILAIEPGDRHAMDLQAWVDAHKDELTAYANISKEQGLALAAELRLHLKASGAIDKLTPSAMPPETVNVITRPLVDFLPHVYPTGGQAVHILAKLMKKDLPGVKISYQHTNRRTTDKEIMRVSIGTQLYGPVLMWTETGWINLFSHGDFDKSNADGGTWSALSGDEGSHLTIGHALDARDKDHKQLFSETLNGNIYGPHTKELKLLLFSIQEI